MRDSFRIRKIPESVKEYWTTIPPQVFAAQTGTPLGRGVFSRCSLKAGEVVEVAPVVLIALNTQPFPGTIRRLVYNWSRTHVALALGYGSLYNHSDRPNLTFHRDPKNLTVTFSALRDIEAGEQLTISYDYTGSGESPREKSWFEIHQVEKVSFENDPNMRPNTVTKNEETL